MKNGGSPVRHFWTSSSIRLVFQWQHVLEYLPGRNIKVPPAQNLLLYSGWSVFSLGLLNLFQRKAPKRRPPIENFPVEVEAPGGGAFPSSGDPYCRHCFSCSGRRRGLARTRRVYDFWSNCPRCEYLTGALVLLW